MKKRAPLSRPPQSAVIDASPLLTLLGLRFINTAPSSTPSFDRIITGAAAEYLKNRPDRQRQFLAYFESLSTLLTTSHVIGELQGLSQAMKLDEEERKRFWSVSSEYLGRLGLDEQLITLLEMSQRSETRAWIGIIGPTDTGLIELARSGGHLLLTDDEKTLSKQAWDLGVDCRLVRNEIG